MSAYVVCTSTMDCVVASLIAETEYGSRIVERFAGLDTSAPDFPTKVGRLLYRMNVAAVRARYADALPGPHDAAKLPRTYTYSGAPHRVPTRDALLTGFKRMEELSYQASEGRVPESKAYKELDRAIGLVSVAFARTFL